MEFISILSDVLTLLPSVRAAASTITGKASFILLEAIGQAEQAALVGLEIIAQIDILTDFGPDSSSNGAHFFLEIVAKKLLPAVSSLSVHVDGDVRVVVSASLRRMIPTVLKDLGKDEVDLCLSAFLSHIPALMSDHAPIPQYTLRLLCEAIRASQYAYQLISIRLISGGGLNLFIAALGGKSNKSERERDRSERDRSEREREGSNKSDKFDGNNYNNNNNDDDHTIECDPQVPVLLRILYEKGQAEEQEQSQLRLRKNQNQFSPDNQNIKKKENCTKVTYVMLELGISQSLCTAVRACLKESGSGSGIGSSSGSGSGSPSGSNGLSVQTELLSSLVELLHR